MVANSALFDGVYTALTEDLRAHIIHDYDPKADLLDSRGMLSSTHDRARSFASCALLKSLPKKYLGRDSSVSKGVPPLQRRDDAIGLWHTFNDRCKDFTVRLRSLEQMDVATQAIVNEASCLIHDWFGGNLRSSFPFWGLVYEFGFGPGTSVGVTESDFFAKVADSPITYSSPDVCAMYQKLVQTNPLWLESETIRAQNHGPGKRVTSKLSTVPKTNVIDRTIEVGPSVNVGFQLAIGRLLESILKVSVGIDLVSQQDVNRRLAYRGSLSKADHGHRWATLDLSSASDSISVGLVERMFTWLPDWKAAMDTFRSTHVTGPTGDEWECHLYSSMGNGFTFPLQTLIFSALVASCYNSLGLPPFAVRQRFSRVKDDGTSTIIDKPRPNFAVFGDDIIVDERVYDLLVRTLQAVGCVVNEDKSFNTGPFRESCGTDWYCGYNVRPVYCESLLTVQDRVSLINRLNRWSAYHSIPLPGTIATLVASIPVWERLLVPNDAGDDAGIHVGLELRELLESKWSLSTKVGKALRLKLFALEDTYVYCHYSPTRNEKVFWQVNQRNGTYVEIPGGYKSRNEAGAFLAALHGSIRGGRATVRMNRVRYTRRFACSPSWGNAGFYGGSQDHWAGSYSAWERATKTNLDVG